jgi:hypothetical protein
MEGGEKENIDELIIIHYYNVIEPLLSLR